MKVFVFYLAIVSLMSSALAKAMIEKFDVKILDPSKGSCVVTIHPGPPRSIDVDVESLVEGKDVTIRFGAFSLIDGNYNEFIESDSISICDLPKSDNPLIAFVYKEMMKAGNMVSACPVTKTKYFLHGFRIEESDLPMTIPKGSFKIELNGTLHEHDKDVPIFVADIFFKEV